MMRATLAVLTLAVPTLAVLPLALLGCEKGPTEQLGATEAMGRAGYHNYCASCHHPEGLGMQGGGPPLQGSPWVAGPEGRIIRIVLNGVRGPLELGGKTYNLEMPGFGVVLNDAQVAAVLSYVRARFGGLKQDVTPKAVSDVRALSQNRRAYWTANELLAIP